MRATHKNRARDRVSPNRGRLESSPWDYVEISAGFLVETNDALIPSLPTGHRNFRESLQASTELYRHSPTSLSDLTQ